MSDYIKAIIVALCIAPLALVYFIALCVLTACLWAVEVVLEAWERLKPKRTVVLLIGCLSLTSHAQPLTVPPAPPGLYTLKYLAWDGPGTNFEVVVRTQTNALPVHVFQTKLNRAAVSNLQYNTTYYLSVKAQSNALWSVESETFTWPHEREDYFATRNYSQATIGGTKIVLPLTLVVTTNVITRAMWGFVGVEAWTSNNITPYVFPE